MILIDIASIVFVSVTANHLGLVKATEETLERELPVINCCKCLAFWSSLFYMLFTTRDIITSLAVSFLCAYIAIWLELFEGFIDTLFGRLYEKIYTNAENDTASSDAD